MRLVVLLAAATWTTFGGALSVLEHDFSPKHLARLKNETLWLFDHAWDAYAANALPFDELRPLSCDGVGPDPNIEHIQRNDVMGNFSVTLLDTLDVFPIFGRDDQFRKYVDFVEQNVSFDQPNIVQVFETTIRAMGGLLSAHLYASVPELGHAIPGYNGHLLAKAHDLGVRLLPAFNTPTGIPYPRVHLQRGVVPAGNVPLSSTCSAGAGSLLLEFGLLSKLTNDPRFDKLARRACFSVWNKRRRNLVGMGIDAITGKWLDAYTSIGSSIDSYYECVLKYAVLFDDPKMRDVWEAAYEAIQSQLCSGFYYHLVGFYSDTLGSSIDALSAFWSGVQVLAGHIVDAVYTHTGYLKLWDNWAGLPERWNLQTRAGSSSIILEWYLLRPEFIESTYYLYRATKDPLYLHVGQVILEDIMRNNVVECGVAATHDVRTGKHSNRMDSFFLSETLKYLYLLFDVDNPLNHDERVIFSTEAHPFWTHFDAGIKRFPLQLETPSSILEWAFGLVSPWLDFLHTPAKAPVCEAWPNVDHSIVASWDLFYQIDKDVLFVPPQWRKREGLLDEHDFMRKYVLDATCKATNASMFK